MSKANWATDVEVDEMIKQYREGWSYTQIAAEYSRIKGQPISRAAIAGKLLRKGVLGSGNGNRGGRPQIKVVKITPQTGESTAMGKATPPADVSAPPIDDDTIRFNAVDFSDMDFLGQCNWIVQDNPTLYCGAVKPRTRKQPYCGHHDCLKRK